MSPTRPKGLRDGWTTGTCAAAAAKAAVTGLVRGAVPNQVEIELPSGKRVVFCTEPDAEVSSDARGPWARAAVVKDAGDDPDCTDGARLTVAARWRGGIGELRSNISEAEDDHSLLCAGDGVGTVSRPGLGIEVGKPAINRVPRRMILASTLEVTDRPLILTFSVPGGQEMAKKTTNGRLGIVGGISILGTTGIVRPFSTAAFRASVAQQVDVAAACGETHIVLATGSRTEAAARRLFPDLDPVCFVEVGDYSGVALRRAGVGAVPRVTMVAMAGKIAKLAAGTMMTHFHRSKIDNQLLKEVALQARSSDPVVRSATETATVRHFFEECVANGDTAPLTLLCVKAARACEEHTAGRIQMQVLMVDFDGQAVVASG